MMRKRLIALFLAAAMLVALTPDLGIQTAYADEEAPAISMGTDVLAEGCNTEAAKTVMYMDTEWRVIGYDGSGAAAADGCLTLLVDYPSSTSMFDKHGTSSNVYADSVLKESVDELAKSLTDGERAAVIKRTLEARSDYAGAETDWVRDVEVQDAILWPLSTKEVLALDSSIRNVDPEHTTWRLCYWWLRSPGQRDDTAAMVYGYDQVGVEGVTVVADYGVRPAVYLDKEAVLFTSAAAGGKASGAVGENALTEVGAGTDEVWKLTLRDSARSGFTADPARTCDGEVLNINYSGAPTGANEYISAIVTDEWGEIRYYGNLKNCAESSDASGTVRVNIDGKLQPSDKLYVFCEQLNGASKTDYASELKEVAIPAVSEHEWVQMIKKASPTEDGWVYRQCSVCGSKELIAPISIVSRIGLSGTSFTYTGKQIKPKVTVANASEELSAENYTVTYSNNTNKGTATVKVTLKGDYYEGSKTLSFTIKAKKITPALTLKTTSYTYDGTVKTPGVTVKDGTTVLKKDTDYTVSYAKGRKNVGEYKVTVTLKGNYSGTASKTFTIKKAANPLKIKARTATVKYSELRKKSQTLAVSKVISFTAKGQGTMSYAKVSGNKKITVNGTTGKVTVQKGLKKGTYSVMVKVKAAGNSNYKASIWKVVTFKIVVK